MALQRWTIPHAQQWQPPRLVVVPLGLLVRAVRWTGYTAFVATVYAGRLACCAVIESQRTTAR